MKNTYKQRSSSHHHLFLTQKVQQQRHHGAYGLPHDKSTLLTYCASRERVDDVVEMVLTCTKSVEDVTVQGETSLHLAVKRSQFEAIKALVELVREMNKVNILNMKDNNGNSVLHLAGWKKNNTRIHNRKKKSNDVEISEVVEWLVGINGITPAALEENNVNQSGLTPLDLLLIFPSEAGDMEIH
ncbi:PREDICTED: ankyrin [Prunus dulcis]|uniref:PREDICTED: ankyrin n=1 Tax=Prunus dulcis TaxID=3755 RepID=A0A5E4E613_PRUDU|nr:hypothetical protein L3X38_014656 [Prunus dulcis]VVA10852.1 PREDICTED: ankyrin [Prunus dulcis]